MHQVDKNGRSLDQVFRACSYDNWDGYGAKAITLNILTRATLLFTHIPLEFRRVAHFSPSADNCICIEICTGKPIFIEVYENRFEVWCNRLWEGKEFSTASQTANFCIKLLRPDTLLSRIQDSFSAVCSYYSRKRYRTIGGELTKGRLCTRYEKGWVAYLISESHQCEVSVRYVTQYISKDKHGRHVILDKLDDYSPRTLAYAVSLGVESKVEAEQVARSVAHHLNNWARNNPNDVEITVGEDPDWDTTINIPAGNSLLHLKMDMC